VILLGHPIKLYEIFEGDMIVERIRVSDIEWRRYWSC